MQAEEEAGIPEGAPRDPGSPVPDDNFELAVASRGRRRGAASGSSRRTRARR